MQLGINTASQRCATVMLLLTYLVMTISISIFKVGYPSQAAIPARRMHSTDDYSKNHNDPKNRVTLVDSSYSPPHPQRMVHPSHALCLILKYLFQRIFKLNLSQTQ